MSSRKRWMTRLPTGAITGHHRSYKAVTSFLESEAEMVNAGRRRFNRAEVWCAEPHQDYRLHETFDLREYGGDR